MWRASGHVNTTGAAVMTTDLVGGEMTRRDRSFRQRTVGDCNGRCPCRCYGAQARPAAIAVAARALTERAVAPRHLATAEVGRDDEARPIVPSAHRRRLQWPRNRLG